MHDPLRIRINSISKSVKFKVPALASHLMRYSNKFKNIPTFIKERIPHKNLSIFILNILRKNSIVHIVIVRLLFLSFCFIFTTSHNQKYENPLTKVLNSIFF